MTDVRAYCDDCHRTQPIVRTGRKQREGWTAEWWQVVTHFIDGQPCPGSGRLV